jgi:hypothetical protein
VGQVRRVRGKSRVSLWCTQCLNYKWSPYVWMPEAVPEGGTIDYLMMDYVYPRRLPLGIR